MVENTDVSISDGINRNNHMFVLVQLDYRL